jgi:anti-anti-sigma factor
MEEIKISVSKRGYGQDIYVVRVDGFIDTITAPELDRTLGTMVDQGKHSLIMDLGGVDYISSAGWGIFISRIKEIRRNGGDLKLARMSPGVYEVFELLEFDRILRAHDSIEKAEKDFGVGYFDEFAPEAGRPQEMTSQEVEPASFEEESSVAVAEMSVEEKIKEIVKEHPFWGSGEIRKELKTERYGGVKLGWWAGWRILRRLGLNSRGKRVEYAGELSDRDR